MNKAIAGRNTVAKNNNYYFLLISLIPQKAVNLLTQIIIIPFLNCHSDLKRTHHPCNSPIASNCCRKHQIWTKCNSDIFSKHQCCHRYTATTHNLSELCSIIHWDIFRTSHRECRSNHIKATAQRFMSSMEIESRIISPDSIIQNTFIMTLQNTH